jgi:RNA polymerase sigma-70 factor, ECF subfamily
VKGPALAHGAAERAARESYGKLLAYLAKRCGGIEDAEDALADAFAAALERWPRDGVPDVPEAWLLVAARHRFLDRVRGDARAVRLHERLGAAACEAQLAFERSPELGDDRLGLMFACAHPAIDSSVRAPLMLQVVLGLDAARIASAFLIAPAAMSQRLVRAKQKIAATGIPLCVPAAEDLPERLDAVLAATYAAYVGGWDDPGGNDSRTRGLAVEAIWLARLLAQICPNEPEVSGLLALMLYTSSRTAARRDPGGSFVALEYQDVSLWNRAAIDEAEALLRRAFLAQRPGRFQLEAAIQSAHAARRFAREPDWAAIVALYDDLWRRTGSPVVALNRAVVLGRLRGPECGLEALDAIASDARLESYQPYWAARADLYARAGRREEARASYARALGLTVDPSVRHYLSDRMESAAR